MIEVKVPEVGESITEGILVEWSASDGGFVRVDDALFVLETDKITMDVNAEHQGRLKIGVEAGQTVAIGQTVATIDTDAKEEHPSDGSGTQGTADSEIDGSSEDTAGQGPGTGPPIETPAGLPQTRAKLEAMNDLSPAVRRLILEHGLDAASITGSGKGGRITKEDVARHLETHQAASSPKTSMPRATEEPVKSPVSQKQTTAAQTGDSDRRQTREHMSTIRQRIAERLVQAQQTAAILTTFNEIDMSRVMEMRALHQEDFQSLHHVKLGFMSFFVKAVVDALKTVPILNAQIQGDEVVYNHFFDIGVAIGTERGLVVPVIRDADRLSFGEIEKGIAELAEKARERKLTLAELTGGVFTISNGGIYGNMMSTPILNPPQSGILGMHTIKKRPVAVGDQILIRPMMYVALSYDHRLIDGREAVTFLNRVVNCIENPERMMLEI